MPGLNRLVWPALKKDIEDGRINTVLCFKIDRITRSMTDFYELHEFFETNGVRFVSLRESFDTNSAMGRAMLKFVLVFAELERIYIQAPLLPNQGLATALMSYNGNVCWGFVADPDLVPDVPVFVELVAQSLQRLADAAGVTLSESSQQVLELLSRSGEGA